MKATFLRRAALALALSAGLLPAAATPVKVTMNSTTRTMTLVSAAGDTVATGEPTSYVYTFEAAPGDYTLTGFTSNGTDNGSIVLNVPDSQETQAYTVYTITFYATNSGWTYGTDYTADVRVGAQAGGYRDIIVGNSTTWGRKTVLVLSGDTVYLTLTPSDEHAAEGYLPYTTSSTRTGSGTLSGKIPMGAYYNIVVPADAKVEVGQKTSHFVDFTVVQPDSVGTDGTQATYRYKLGSSLVYNVRTWRAGGLTHALYFTKGTDEETLTFTNDDYAAMDPKKVNHDPTSNDGYETGDIFLNINARGHLVMNVGETFDAHAMRSWELTDTQVGNYFFEPDFHYTVLGLDGKPCSDVIEISTDETTSAWRTVKAVGEGEAIVLVTYDAISCTYKGKDTAYMGGQYWGAIWPENTGVFVVSVGKGTADIEPDMTVNEAYNVGEDGSIVAKMAGVNVDAEHDVFYYLDTEEGFPFTFTPKGAVSVTVASAEIGANTATYRGFTSEGVTAGDDGSYTVMLKYGRNIVRLTDAQGRSVYQVLNAKPCHRVITNNSRSDSELYYPGDEVTVQYSGLFHPANKMAGIYNMSAYVTFNGTPNGTSLILSANQYKFGSVATAQAVNFTIPELVYPDGYIYTLDEGVIQINGYGDQIGNHRNTSRTTGRSPNFTATVNKSYYGSVPAVSLPIGHRKSYAVTLQCNVDSAAIELVRGGLTITPDSTGVYRVYDGELSITATAPDYHKLRLAYTITEETDSVITIPLEMVYSKGCWDGVATSKPEADSDGVYQIYTPAELAWLAAWINAKNTTQDAVLMADIDLGEFDWTPIGNVSPYYTGTFDGRGHKIEGLYINSSTTYQGLFHTLHHATVKDLTVYGSVTASAYAGGIAGRTYWTTSTKTPVNVIEGCANYADVSGGYNIGGIVGYIHPRSYTGATFDEITNCLNGGTITASQYRLAGLVGYDTKGVNLTGALNVGTVVVPADNPSNFGACIYYLGYTPSTFSGLYSTAQYTADGEPATGADTMTTIATDSQMASGEIAWLLGAPFGQAVGEDAYPSLRSAQVYRVAYTLITESTDEESAIPCADTEEPTALYTNGALPTELDGYKVKWYADAALTTEVTAVVSDATLYAVSYGLVGWSGAAPSRPDADVRYYNLQGIPVAAPEPGRIYIVRRGARATKERF